MTRITLDNDNILKTYSNGAPELGEFSMSVNLLETVSNLSASRADKKEILSTLAEQLKTRFPIFYELVNADLTHREIISVVGDNLEMFIHQFKKFENIVVVGIEYFILDILTSAMPGTNFYVIPHRVDIDKERVISNFPGNVNLIGIRDVISFHKNKSAILSYAYFYEPYGGAFVYPAMLRVIGTDVRSLYMDIVGLCILRSYTFYPHTLTPISPGQFFAKQYRLV